VVLLGLMLVSSCTDPRSAATSEHDAAEADVAEADADGAAALDEGLPADAGLPDALPPEPQAAASSTRPERRMPRQACRLSVALLILCEPAAERPASPHTQRVKFRCSPPSPIRGDAVVTGWGSAHAAHFDQVKTEKPDSLEHAMQAGLIELSPDHRDAAASGDVQAGERGGRPLIEPTRDTDLVTREHKVSSFPAVLVLLAGNLAHGCAARVTVALAE
jgi:hypothetical protein